jgi:4-hydroxy-tetrahydrodipicolinate synthase
MTAPSLPSSPPHLIAALVTPFTSGGEVDRGSLARLISHLRKGGIDEYFVVGSTGEAPLLDDAARLSIVETARAAGPAAFLYAGISGTGHRHAIRNARDAARAGADVAVLMAPHFLSLDQEQLAGFCTAVADESPIPLAIYHHVRMPSPFAVPTIARLAGHPNIVAIKDTNGGDHNRGAEILAATAGQSLLFFQGVEKLVLSSLEAGGHGCVVAQGCIAPQLFRALFNAWQSGDLPQARVLQERVTMLWSIFGRREVKQSFSHFLHTLKLPLYQRGVLATTFNALPRVVFEPEFERMITVFMQEHLENEPALRRAG